MSRLLPLLLGAVALPGAGCKGGLDSHPADGATRRDSARPTDAAELDARDLDAPAIDTEVRFDAGDAGPPVPPVLPGLDAWPYRVDGQTVPLRGSLNAYNPHRDLAHTYRGSGHTHAAPDHSDFPADMQEGRLRDLPAPHGHDFVWLTAHNFVAPDPGVDSIVHLFGTEVYASEASSGESPHMIVFLPDGSLADVSAEPFGRYDYPMAEVVRRVVAVGGLPTLAHPVRYSPTVDETVALPDALWGIEGVSGWSDIDDNLAFIDARLSAGKYTCISAGNDLHDSSDGLTVGFQLVGSDRADPTAADLFEQVRACNFFACTVQSPSHAPLDPRLTISDGTIHFRVTADVDRIDFIGIDGRVLHRVDGRQSVSYVPHGDEGYVRISAERDSGRARCLSQPIWLLDGE